MKKRRSITLYGTLAALYVLHNDWWFWNDERLILGLPAGLLYHLFLCFGAAAILALLVFGKSSQLD